MVTLTSTMTSNVKWVFNNNPHFYDGFERSCEFYVRYDLDYDLNLDHEGVFLKNESLRHEAKASLLFGGEIFF